MTIDTPSLLDVIKEQIERKEWDKAISLLSQLRAADEADLFSGLSNSEKRELLSHLSYEELAATYHRLNPVLLLKQINENLESLWKLAVLPADQQRKAKTQKVLVT